MPPEVKLADSISHFMFRLAFCKTEEQRLWFLKYESEVFVKKLLEGRESAIEEIVKYFNSSNRRLKELEVHRDRDSELWNDLTACISDSKKKDVMKFYAAPFEGVCNLLPGRRYYLKKGLLYIPEDELPYCIQVIYRDKLKEALNYTLSKGVEVAADPRVAKLLGKIRGWQAAGSYSSVRSKLNGKIELAELDSLEKKLYSPCCKVLHNALKANSHLKHDGRMQYGLFLKGIGITLEESLTFWRTEFTRKISVEAFQKKYVYNIKHNYGKEGKKADYTPWTCTKILNLPPPLEGQYHGCPFKTFSTEKLVPLLKQYGINDNAMRIIVRAKETFQYELACLKLFEAINPDAGNIGNSPHAFLIETYNYHRQKNSSEAKAQATKDKPVVADTKTKDIEDMAI